MFDAKTNDGYYELGLISAQLIRDVMLANRSGDADTIRHTAKHPSGEEGVTKMIEILKEELETTMQLMGEGDVDGFRGNTTFVSACSLGLDWVVC